MQVRDFYDALASDYHLIAADWDSAVHSQGKTLSGILRRAGVDDGSTLLDCSCGIGTQAIGLSLHGYAVTASDLSPMAVERAKAEAARLGARMAFAVADFRSLSGDVEGRFDVVLSCDNSIPHLLTKEDLESGARSIASKTKDGGVLLISVRDYDQIRREKPTGMPPRKIVDAHGTRVYFQTWDWDGSGESYELELFLVRKAGNEWKTTSFQSRYRAWTRDEIQGAFGRAGFLDGRWIEPGESSYYQPLFIAKMVLPVPPRN